VNVEKLFYPSAPIHMGAALVVVAGILWALFGPGSNIRTITQAMVDLFHGTKLSHRMHGIRLTRLHLQRHWRCGAAQDVETRENWQPNATNPSGRM
jgi:hypothetical protein